MRAGPYMTFAGARLTLSPRVRLITSDARLSCGHGPLWLVTNMRYSMSEHTASHSRVR